MNYLRISDVRDYIAALGIAEDDNCYCGMMSDKRDQSIGVYNMRPDRYQTAVGGPKNRSYLIKPVRILIHWNHSIIESEDAALRLQDCLLSCRNTTINGHLIKYIEVTYDEPISVATDEKGIYEYVIEAKICYAKGDV